MKTLVSNCNTHIYTDSRATDFLVYIISNTEKHLLLLKNISFRKWYISNNQYNIRV